ncbi:hypothetical protein ACEPAI_7669 [Sanghuangporus weigelae]
MVLSVLSIWSARSSTTNSKSRQTQKGSDEPIQVTISPATVDAEDGAVKDTVKTEGGTTAIGDQEPSEAPVDPPVSTSEHAGDVSDPNAKPKESRPVAAPSRFSIRALRFFYSPKSAITHEQDATERKKAKTAAQRASISVLSRSSEKRVQKNAFAVQRLIVGSDATTMAHAKARPTPVSRAQMTRIKSDLMKPKSANKLIKKLRELPVPEEHVEDTGVEVSTLAVSSKAGSAPIHAVCLESTESDVQTKHFSKLKEQSVISAGVDALSSLFSELHIVDLLAAPDLGLGQPGDGEGLLAGAIPTAETVIEGAAKLTPQLMALGFATGKAVFPDHSTIYPPTDRMSVLTYWWGLELCLPPPTLTHLSQAPNISHQVINFLSALSLMYNGVREMLPFVRYIGQFVDFEWAQIERQDKGKGVVCAATWIMPAAMVPRSWDFPDPPSASRLPAHGGTPGVILPSTPQNQGPAPDVSPPTFVVTPPSIIKSTSSQVASASTS